jgi:hypothetical protein
MKHPHAWNKDRKEVEICATNITNKTKCMSIHAKKWKKKIVKTCSNTTRAICGVKYEPSRLKLYVNQCRICHVIQSFSVS